MGPPAQQPLQRRRRRAPLPDGAGGVAAARAAGGSGPRPALAVRVPQSFHPLGIRNGRQGPCRERDMLGTSSNVASRRPDKRPELDNAGRPSDLSPGIRACRGFVPTDCLSVGPSCPHSCLREHSCALGGQPEKRCSGQPLAVAPESCRGHFGYVDCGNAAFRFGGGGTGPVFS